MLSVANRLVRTEQLAARHSVLNAPLFCYLLLISRGIFFCGTKTLFKNTPRIRHNGMKSGDCRFAVGQNSLRLTPS